MYCNEIFQNITIVSAGILKVNFEHAMIANVQWVENSLPYAKSRLAQMYSCIL